MIKKYYKYVLLFLFCFVITFLYNFFLLNVNCDEIWNYGFSYNISKGMIIYRDFNVLQTPLFFFIGSLFIKIFGSHIYAYDIYISVIVSILILLCYRKIGKNALILLFIVIPNLAPSYNSLCVLLTVIVLFINDSDIKNKNFWIGIVIGLLFLTKQSIGIVLLIAMIIFDRNKIRGFIGFCIPCLFFLVYLLVFDALYEFINYCFLGIFDFGKSNLVFSSSYFIIFIITICIIFIGLVKSKAQNIMLSYLLAFQIMAYPIFDRNHIMLGVVLCIIYLFVMYDKIIIKYFKYFLIIGICYFISICFLPKNNYHFYKNNSSFLNNKGLYSDELISYDMFVSKIEENIIKYHKDYDNIHVYSIYSSELSYVCKLDLGYKIDKYDLILDGNMGYKGGEKYIYELDSKCRNESCLFFIDNNVGFEFSQTNRDIYNYVINNFNKIKNIDDKGINFSIYSNVGDDVYE